MFVFVFSDHLIGIPNNISLDSSPIIYLSHNAEIIFTCKFTDLNYCNKAGGKSHINMYVTQPLFPHHQPQWPWLWTAARPQGIKIFMVIPPTPHRKAFIWTGCTALTFVQQFSHGQWGISSQSGVSAQISVALEWLRTTSCQSNFSLQLPSWSYLY